jgi:hypothetical protein
MVDRIPNFRGGLKSKAISTIYLRPFSYKVNHHPMKKILLTLSILAATASFASAQILPTFQFGVKAGLNLASLNYSNPVFNAGNQAGYLGGVWARFGALGFNFQPELYLTEKNVSISENGAETKAHFTSVDLPLLLGGKVGAFGVGIRFYTGPVVSFAVNKDQSISGDVRKAVSLDYKDQNLAWQVGAGVDIKQLSIDLRAEGGITEQTYGYSHTRVSLLNLSLGYSLFKL